jgi:protoporphyrinogen oxidase
MWIPLLRSKLGENYRKTSAAFIWGSIQRMYSARRSGAKKETFGYIPGGYASILEGLHRRLEAEGVAVRLQHAARLVERTAAGAVRVDFANGHSEEFDQVALAMASPIAARLCPALSAEEKQKLNAIQYLGIICASVLLKKPLAGYYVTNLTDAGAPYTGIIEMTALADRAHFGGNTLVYLPKYVSSDDAAFDLSDEEIRHSFLGALFALHGHLSEGDVLDFKLTREKYVMAIPTLNYSKNLAPTQTSVAGVHIVNSSHILDGTLTVDASLRVAEAAMPKLLAAGGAAAPAALAARS